jgi:hypothetical protein
MRLRDSIRETIRSNFTFPLVSSILPDGFRFVCLFLDGMGIFYYQAFVYVRHAVL